MAHDALAARIRRSWRRMAVATLFAGILAFQVLMPVRGLVMRWHDGDTDGSHRYSWHMYSTLDR